MSTKDILIVKERLSVPTRMGGLLTLQNTKEGKEVGFWDEGKPARPKASPRSLSSYHKGVPVAVAWLHAYTFSTHSYSTCATQSYLRNQH